MNNIEVRAVNEPIEIREIDGKPAMIVGWAVIYDQRSHDLGGFREVVKPGAFAESLKGGEIPVLAKANHRDVLGSSASGTLRLFDEQRGLRYEIDIPDTSVGRDTVEMIRRGDMRGSSFGFLPRENGAQWKRDGEVMVRELISLNLYDVSPTYVPAYPNTDVALRSLQAHQGAETFNNGLLHMQLELAEKDILS